MQTNNTPPTEPDAQQPTDEGLDDAICSSCIILSASMGVYLGSCMGLGFWSKLDPAGQDEAVTFPAPGIAMAHVAEWESLADHPCDLTYPFVSDANSDGYATEAECVDAGAAPWIIVPNAKHSLDDSTKRL
jgi:hypothetical protein